MLLRLLVKPDRKVQQDVNDAEKKRQFVLAASDFLLPGGLGIFLCRPRRMPGQQGRPGV